MKKTSLRDVVLFIIAIVVCESVGLLGSLSTINEIPTWYAGLEKPLLNPPSWVFGPVWTLLYAMMGISAVLIYKQGRKAYSTLWVFAGQLILNAIWTPVFFGWHRLDLALGIIVLMWIVIVATIVQFSRYSKKAAYLLVPYLGWVTFATYLNVSLWMLNR